MFDIGDLIVYNPPGENSIPLIIFYVYAFEKVIQSDLEPREGVGLWSSKDKKIVWESLADIFRKIADKPNYHRIIKRGKTSNIELFQEGRQLRS